jgi:hypothetical protein
VSVGIAPVKIRQYKNKDLSSIIDIYKSAFSEPPWNETWTDEEVIYELEKCLKAPNPIILVAQQSYKLIGLTWGFDCDSQKFPFLDKKFLIMNKNINGNIKNRTTTIYSCKKIYKNDIIIFPKNTNKVGGECFLVAKEEKLLKSNKYKLK